jgi:hypothetical protein
MGAACTTASPRKLAPTIIAREEPHGIVMNAPTLHERRTSARGVRPLLRGGSDCVRSRRDGGALRPDKVRLTNTGGAVACAPVWMAARCARTKSG